MDSNDGDATKRGEASLIDLVMPVYDVTVGNLVSSNKCSTARF
jgi:hypothetical protein